MASIIEFVIIFLTGFGVNLIPFAGPSNLLIAYTAAIGLGNADVSTLVIIGLLIALGAALAKGIHYMVTFFVSGHLSQKRQARLNADANKIRKWAFALLFLVAATPLPDEPVVIPLGLMKYSPVKFFSAYFLGKLTIAVAGAFIGQEANNLFSGCQQLILRLAKLRTNVRRVDNCFDCPNSDYNRHTFKSGSG